MANTGAVKQSAESITCPLGSGSTAVVLVLPRGRQVTVSLHVETGRINGMPYKSAGDCLKEDRGVLPRSRLGSDKPQETRGGRCSINFHIATTRTAVTKDSAFRPGYIDRPPWFPHPFLLFRSS